MENYTLFFEAKDQTKIYCKVFKTEKQFSLRNELNFKQNRLI